MTTIKHDKAFKQRSVVGLILKIGIGVVLVLVLAAVGLRFGSKSTWDSGIDWLNGSLETPLLGLFSSLSVRYVDEAQDMDPEEKQAWKTRLTKTASALREEKGTVTTRQELRCEYEAIAGKMQDGDLTKAELAPFQKNLDTVLERIETEEVQKRE
jgi:hypothetical protein